MKSGLLNLFFFLILIFSVSCAGTHGYIKLYAYSESKENVERAINTLYKIEPRLISPIKNERWLTRSPFFTFYLEEFNPPLLYQIRFYGDEELWDTQKSYSQYAIIYVKEGEADTKSEGNTTKEERGKYAHIFEQKIKKKIDAVLMDK